MTRDQSTTGEAQTHKLYLGIPFLIKDIQYLKEATSGSAGSYFTARGLKVVSQTSETTDREQKIRDTYHFRDTTIRLRAPEGFADVYSPEGVDEHTRIMELEIMINESRARLQQRRGPQ